MTGRPLTGFILAAVLAPALSAPFSLALASPAGALAHQRAGAAMAGLTGSGEAGTARDDGVAQSPPASVLAPDVEGAALVPLTFADMPGWRDDDHAEAFAVFLRSCTAIVNGEPSLRPAGAPGERLIAMCREGFALAQAGPVSREAARRFFEAAFQPFRILPSSGSGFLTGYFEPDYPGSLVRDERFAFPLRGRPADLVTIPAGETLPGIPEGLRAAMRLPDGGFAVPPERGDIWDGALDSSALPIVWLERPALAFIIHVQGSARITLPDGSAIRVGYAGRNGHPYSSIGRVLVERGHLDLETMSLARLLAWLGDHPDEADEIMRMNRSYIFFRILDDLGPQDGPIGGAGFPLTAHRSLAVDRQIWRYGLPFWLDGEIPDAAGKPLLLRRLMIAQDTGSAILGPARGDYFAGSGEEAGRQAGLIRHRPAFTVLLPRERLAPDRPGND